MKIRSIGRALKVKKRGKTSLKSISNSMCACMGLRDGFGYFYFVCSFKTNVPIAINLDAQAHTQAPAYSCVHIHSISECISSI